VIEIYEIDEKVSEIAEENLINISKILQDIRSQELGKDVTDLFITSAPTTEKKAKRRTIKNVFVVHGRDHELVNELKTMLEGFGLNPIILHEQPGGSRTIVEKLERYSDVGYAFVILTPDDVGCEAPLFSKIPKELIPFIDLKPYDLNLVQEFLKSFKSRARQNVVLEFGYFIGLLGRDKVCCLHKGNVELPSDMQGIVYIPFKESINEARKMIIKELSAAGYQIKE
jgi:predicted nucleotide-binding protein